MSDNATDRFDPPAGLAGLTLRPMNEADLDRVLEIESSSFASPWLRDHFLYEIRQNRYAVTTVVELDGAIAAYSCVWHLDCELKVNNVAVAPAFRRKGLARWFMLRLFQRASDSGCRTVDLEVRPSNVAALELYRSLGLTETGRRKNYYRVEGEDAILMSGAL